MTVYFNVTDAIGPAPNHGITRTERRLARALVDRDDVAFVLVRDGRLWTTAPEAIAPLLDHRDITRRPVVERFGIDPAPSSARRTVIDRVRALRRGTPIGSLPVEPVRSRSDDTLVSVGLDWVHGTIDVAERHVFGAGGRFVGMCYDLIPVDHPEWLFPPDPEGFRRHLRRLSRVASRIMCISECTRSDLLRNVPDLTAERAPVIRLGADAAVSSGPAEHEFARALFAGEPYAVYCATVDRRKNHQLLYRAMRELVRRGDPGNMVFVGRVGSGMDDLIDCLRHDRSVAGRIVHVTECDDHHLAALYRHAACAVYPSLYEGWGLGVTEALAHGTPCLIASGSSLAEAGLGICTELHPLRTEPWVDALARYLVDPPRLPAVELPTWDAAADQLLEMVRS